MPRKPREDSEPSTLKPPVDAPEWAVKQVRHTMTVSTQPTALSSTGRIACVCDIVGAHHLFREHRF